MYVKLVDPFPYQIPKPGELIFDFKGSFSPIKISLIIPVVVENLVNSLKNCVERLSIAHNFIAIVSPLAK